MRRWLLFTRTPAQLQGPHVLSRLTGPAWDACDELEPEDVATADGVNMILDTLAEAFQGEYDVDRSHTAYVSQAKEALIEQEEDIDLETALAALELESDTDLEETDVQEIPLACKESRQLRGEQRVSCDQEYGCAAMMSLASQTLTASGENGTSGTIAVLLATDFATVLATLLCRAPAMESSVLALRTRCRTAVRAVGVRERRRSIAAVTCGEGQYNRSGFVQGTLDKSMPDHKKTSVQRW